jgi:lantibiotic modifying enzyme
MTETPWTPLLTGKAGEPYREVLDRIVESCHRFPAPPGDLGQPLLHAYLGVTDGDAACRARALALRDTATRSIEQGRWNMGLFGGVAGVGWLAAHISRLLGEPDDLAYDDLDDVLHEFCVRFDHRRAPYDLIGGPVGIGIYFLERLPDSRAAEALSEIARVLEGSADRVQDLVTWFTPPNVVPLTQKTQAPDGYFNLGVAHGVPGVLGVLSAMGDTGGLLPEHRELLRQTLYWILAQQQPDGTYPSWLVPSELNQSPIDPNSGSPSSRLAWCYGELGVSLTLLSAARLLNDASAEAEALKIASLAAARRDRRQNLDAGLCHGAAGNAHLFNRLFQATRDESFRDAAIYWYDAALALRRPGIGIAGYQAYKPRDGQHIWQDDPSFLTGASGIALAFLAATSDIEPKWDVTLLSCLRPIPEGEGKGPTTIGPHQH